VISIADLKAAEGQRATVALKDGTLLTDCLVVSVGRLWARSVWLVEADIDLFTRPDQIAGIALAEQGQAA
jgi:hypothetical protein